MIDARFRTAVAMAMLLWSMTPASAHAEKKYGPGVTDTEIKIGNTMPYSGPASVYGTMGRAEAAYFRMINDRGGVNGRKITFISLDDAYSPPRTLEHTRKLVEHHNVLLVFSGFGTATNSAVHKYLNDRKVPQLFLISGASKWGDPGHFPWTMGWQPTYHDEGRILARYLLETRPTARIGVLYQKDDYGKDYVNGFRQGLGAKASAMIVKEVTYEVTDPTIESQIVALRASGADVFFDVSLAKFAAQAIRKSDDLGWHPLHLLNSIATGISSVLKPAGLERSTGIVSVLYAKDPMDPQIKTDTGYQDWLTWMTKYYPEGDRTDPANVTAYNLAMTLVRLLEQCGEDLTRENVIAQAANLSFELPLLLPGVRVTTGPAQFFPIRTMQLRRFNGSNWERLGGLVTAE